VGQGQVSTKRTVVVKGAVPWAFPVAVERYPVWGREAEAAAMVRAMVPVAS
jgi:hypothetical protein